MEAKKVKEKELEHSLRNEGGAWDETGRKGETVSEKNCGNCPIAMVPKSKNTLERLG